MKKNYLIKSCYLLNKIIVKSTLLFTTLVLTSCLTKPPLQLKTVTNYTKTSVTHKSNERELLLSTIDYFSNNYPYSTLQVENFYGHKFKLIEVEHGLNNSFEIDHRTNLHPFIKDIDVRATDIDSKLLIIDFKNPICFSRKEFKQSFPRFVLNPRGRLDTYSRILDEEKKLGTLSLRLELNKGNKEWCMKSTIFDIYTTFSLKEYLHPIRRAARIKHKY